MVLHPRWFEPQEPDDEDGRKIPWDWPETLTSDRHCARFFGIGMMKLSSQIRKRVYETLIKTYTTME
jgi:hypothetical protein